MSGIRNRKVEKNKNYVKEWLGKEYHEYVKEARERKTMILFQDESGMQSSPKVREMRDRISISLALTEDGDLYFMIVKESMNEERIITFLGHLLSVIAGFLYIFWDNIMIHWSGKVKEHLGIRNNRDHNKTDTCIFS